MCDSHVTPSPHTGQLHTSEQSVEELLLVGLGPGGAHPLLLSLIDQELIIYRAFPCRQTQSTGHLQLRFSKVRKCNGFVNHLLVVIIFVL